MEENQNQENKAQDVVENTDLPQEPKAPNVSFPTVGQKNKGSGARTLIILGVLLLVAAFGFVIFKGATKIPEGATPTPTVSSVLTPPVPTVAPTPVSAPVDKSKVTIQVLNGTGIVGEAGYLQGQLQKEGYTNVKVGNAEKQDMTTTKATFSDTVSGEVTDEIVAKLKDIYKEVNTVTSSSGTFDIVIETGLRKGSTPKPTATLAPTPTATSSASPTPTPTSTTTTTP